MNELLSLLWTLVLDPRIWIIIAFTFAGLAFLMDEEEQSSGEDREDRENN